MRRVLFIAALFAVLAACSLKSPEGAACSLVGESTQCPAGQRCGADGACSFAANECGEICTVSTCNGQDGKTLNICVQNGVCASFAAPVNCAPNQVCDESTEACECPALGCGQFRECRQAPGVSGLSCECKDSGGCTAAGTMCSSGGRATVSCKFADNCYYAEGVPTDCGALETCLGVPGSAKCSCPDVALTPADGAGCVTVGDQVCNGETILTCVQPPSSNCRVWQAGRNCTASSLVCRASAPTAACACPVVAGPTRTFFADPRMVPEPGVDPSGADSDLCRFKSLQAALGAATSSGDTVKAVGALPVVFTEEPLTVPRGVTLTTVDVVPTPTNYMIQPADIVAGSALVTLQPGATISGFELRNRAATGSAIASGCPGAADTAEVTIDTVAIAGRGTVNTSNHFLHGVHHTGKCSLVLRGSTIEGAVDSGLYVNNSSPVALTLTNNTIQLNSGTEKFTIDGAQRTSGGFVLKGQTPQSIAFRQNRLLGNAGDQVLVFVADPVDLSSSACDSSSNVIACYATGVGIASAAPRVDASFSTWWNDRVSLVQGQDYVLDPGVFLDGTGTACPKYTGSCPTPP